MQWRTSTFYTKLGFNESNLRLLKFAKWVGALHSKSEGFRQGSSQGIPGDLLATTSLTSDDWGCSLPIVPKLVLGQSNDWQKIFFWKL